MSDAGHSSGVGSENQEGVGGAGPVGPDGQPLADGENAQLPGDLQWGRRQQRNAPANSNVASDVITLDTLVTAFSQMRSGGPDVTKGKLPEWQKGDDFIAFEQKVELWAQAHDIKHLLFDPPDLSDSSELKMHAKARNVVLNALNANDRTTVYNMPHLCDAWSYLKSRYRPSSEKSYRARAFKAKHHSHNQIEFNPRTPVVVGCRILPSVARRRGRDAYVLDLPHSCTAESPAEHQAFTQAA